MSEAYRKTNRATGSILVEFLKTMVPPKKNVSRGSAEADNDPERENRTQARASNPLKRKGGGSRHPRGGAADEGSYQTGHNYEVDAEGLAGDGEVHLEGDGLEALDPEIEQEEEEGRERSAEADRTGSDEEEESGPQEEPEEDAGATRAGPPLTLEIVAGPDAGKKKKFKGVRMIIGRTPGVDLLLSDQSVSRRHVELIYGDDGVLMKDLGSGNGTKVNGVKVPEKKLEHGDEIAIGKTKIRFVDELTAFKKAREENERAEAAKAQEEAPPTEPAPEAAEEGAAGDAEGSDAEMDHGELAGEAQPPQTEQAPEKQEKLQSRQQRPARKNEAGGRLAARWRALSKPVRIAMGAGAVILAVIGVLALQHRDPEPPPIDPAKVSADEKMQEARNAARAGDFARVVALVEQAEKLVPGIDRSRMGPMAQEELGFLAALEVARTAIEAKRFEDAKAALDKAKGSKKSEEARLKVQDELEMAERAYKLEQISEYLASGELEAAKRVLGELPVEVQAAPAREIADYERQRKEELKKAAKNSAAVARQIAASKQERRAIEIDEAFSVVQRKFGGTEWQRAASECARVMVTHAGDEEIHARAKALQELIIDFGRNYDEGLKKYRQGALGEAARPLRVAHQLYGKINLRANKFGQELEEKIGAAAVVAGKEALLRDDLVTAWQMFQDAARFDPTDSKARSGLEELSNRAEELFQSAYIIRDRDQKEAIRKFKIVVLVTSAGSAIHEKAKNQLAAMNP